MAVRKVELFGLARVLAATSVLEIDVPEPATVRAVMSALGAHRSQLVGPILRADLSGPAAGYTLNVNGLAFVDDLETVLNPGDVLLLLPASAGG